MSRVPDPNSISQDIAISGLRLIGWAGRHPFIVAAVVIFLAGGLLPSRWEISPFLSWVVAVVALIVATAVSLRRRRQKKT